MDILLQFLYVKSVVGEDTGRHTRTGEVKVARAPEEMTPVLGEPKPGTFERASQSMIVERDKNELP